LEHRGFPPGPSPALPQARRRAADRPDTLLYEFMPRQLVECVPNFSEGRDAAKMDAIVQAILTVPEVVLLDRESDADHNRSVLTFVGPPAAVADAALRGVAKAVELIDLTRHQGAHPRIGAADVVPFIPIEGVTLEECVRLAERVAGEIWNNLRVPVYLYESAARRPDRVNHSDFRLMCAKPRHDTRIGRRLRRLAQNVGIDQVLHSACVGSEPMGTKKFFCGQASSQSMAPSFRGAARRTRR